LVTLYFLFHLIQKSPLAGFHVLQGDFADFPPGGFLFHSLLYPFSDEKRDFGDRFFRFLRPIHKDPP
jgi:hypothetical protein